MAMIALAQSGNYLHIYDFRVKPGQGEKFIELFETFDYSDDNPMHKSPAQAKDGVLCRDVDDPDRFYLIGEWTDIEAHAEIRRQLAQQGLAFTDLIEDVEKGAFVPRYGEVVSSTPQHILDRAAE